MFSFLGWSVNRWFYIFCSLGLFSLTWMTYKLSSTTADGHPMQEAVARQVLPLQPIVHQASAYSSPVPTKQKLTVENRALLILTPSKRPSTITIAMLHSRFRHDIIYYEHAGVRDLHTSESLGLYSIVIFEDLATYLAMDSDDRAKVDSYCKVYKVGVIVFTLPQNQKLNFNRNIFHLPLTFSTGIPISTYVVNPTPLVSIAKASVPHDLHTVKDWVVFHPNHATYQSLCHGTLSPGANHTLTLAVLDTGQFDGIRRVFFGHRHSLWIHKIMLLDAIDYLTRGAMMVAKDKYIQIDIDDIFIGSNGTKMKPPDVTVRLLCVSRAWVSKLQRFASKS